MKNRPGARSGDLNRADLRPYVALAHVCCSYPSLGPTGGGVWNTLFFRQAGLGKGGHALLPKSKTGWGTLIGPICGQGLAHVCSIVYPSMLNVPQLFFWHKRRVRSTVVELARCMLILYSWPDPYTSGPRWIKWGSGPPDKSKIYPGGPRTPLAGTRWKPLYPGVRYGWGWAWFEICLIQSLSGAPGENHFIQIMWGGRRGEGGPTWGYPSSVDDGFPGPRPWNRFRPCSFFGYIDHVRWIVEPRRKGHRQIFSCGQ